MSEPPLVSVVVPVYNGERTIDETLRSVRSQTHSELEIIVVDDGSKDGTTDIVERHARVDPRVRLIRQENGGVARARNRGIAEARADLIAPVDADDLWAVDKIEKQVAVIERGGPEMGLVYTLFAHIDSTSRITQMDSPKDAPEGDVLRRVCAGNFIGNGSSALIRRAALERAGGYDPSLRDRKAQGCEDRLIYFRIAEHFRFGVVRESLTGYRITRDNMSSDAAQMFRSHLLVQAEVLGRHPEYRAEVRSAGNLMAHYLVGQAIRSRRLDRATGILKEFARNYSWHAVQASWTFAGAIVKRLTRRFLRQTGITRVAPKVGVRYEIGEPAPSAREE